MRTVNLFDFYRIHDWRLTIHENAMTE